MASSTYIGRICPRVFSVTTTPNIYVSFFAPDSAGVMPANAARLTAPLLVVASPDDRTQRGRGYVFDRAPDRPLNRYVTIAGDHIATVPGALAAVEKWLSDLGAARHMQLL